MPKRGITSAFGSLKMRKVSSTVPLQVTQDTSFGSYLLFDVMHSATKFLRDNRNDCEKPYAGLDLPQVYVQHLRGRRYARDSKNALNKVILGKSDMIRT